METPKPSGSSTFIRRGISREIFWKTEEFTNDYDQEELDFSEYLNFILLPLKKWGPEKVKPWGNNFFWKIQPRYVFRTSCMIIEDKDMSLFW